MLLMHGLSESHELTAMRSFGLSILNCLLPILIVSVGLSVLNFWIVSEMGTASHLNSTRLKAELRLVNPLLLMNHKHLIKMKGLYFEALGPSKLGESAEDALFAYPEKKSGKIALFVAKKLSIQGDQFVGDDVTILGPLKQKVVLENIKEYRVDVNDFAVMLENKTWNVNLDYLKLPLLLVQKEREKNALKELLESGKASLIKAKERAITRIDLEIIRRASIGFAVFSLTLLGLGFGIGITRGRKVRNILKVVVLASLFLIGYFTAKGIDHQFLPAALLYTVPHALILICSLRAILKIEKGIP
jgi:lipopolysaccharide export system permease protein